MRILYIASSRKFYRQVEELVQELKKKNIVGLTPMKVENANDFASEKKALLTAFEMIENADAMYVVAPDGYVGKAVAMEMAFAYAKGKQIISSEEIVELSARALVSEIRSLKQLLDGEH